MEEIDDWTMLLEAQAGIVSRRQLLARGITDDTVQAHVAGGRWSPLHLGVYATFTGPLSVQARRWAALLACWPCALSHDTAAEVHGLLRPGECADGRVHVVRPFGRSTFRVDGLVVHRSRAFEHIVVPGSDPPIVSLVHTAIDLALSAATPADAEQSLLHSFVSTHLRPEAVRAAIELRRPRRWKKALLAAVDHAEGGVTSVLEARWTRDVESAHGLPAPCRQVPVLVDGMRRDEDIIYRHGTREVVVRLDGRRFHVVESVNRVDRRRANAAVLAGRPGLVYGWAEVTEQPCLAAREVATVLGCVLVPCVQCSVP